MIGIPASLNSVTAEWLTSAFEDQAIATPGISSLSYEPMPGIVGALGEIGIFTIDWAGPTDLPDRLVGKCPLDDDMAKLFNSVMQYYRRESGFYADVAPQIRDAGLMKLPECYLNVTDPDSDQNLLLIEHCGEATDGDILAGGLEPEPMLRLVEDLARVHGKYWLDDKVGDLPWLLDWSTESFQLGIPVTQEGWSTFRNREPDFFDPALAEVLDRTYINDTIRLLDVMTNRPWTFTHGDYELDNFLFCSDDSVIILDWQTVMKSFPGVDLGWFLACSHSEASLAEERTILDRYRKVLAESGGPEWSHDQLIEDLAFGMMFHVTGQTVTATADYEDRAKRRFRHMLEGCHAAALRWNVTEVIAEA